MLSFLPQSRRSRLGIYGILLIIGVFTIINMFFYSFVDEFSLFCDIKKVNDIKSKPYDLNQIIPSMQNSLYKIYDERPDGQDIAISYQYGDTYYAIILPGTSIGTEVHFQMSTVGWGEDTRHLGEHCSVPNYWIKKRFSEMIESIPILNTQREYLENQIKVVNTLWGLFG